MKKLSILGSTGSIGTQALEIARKNPNEISVEAISLNKNTELAKKQIEEFRPKLVCVYDEKSARVLKDTLSSERIAKTEIVSEMEGLKAAASYDSADMVLTAVVGMIGIEPTMSAIEAGKDIALANKETLVCAGHLIIDAARRNNVKIYPVDSEHSAIFQSLNGEDANPIEKILLTASGGPFRGYDRKMLSDVRLEDALNHPNWKMGAKVTIDSATLANKGLEVMEACHLFGVGPEKIQVVVHPQSIIHSMVQYEDGAVIAQLGIPDMKIPIQYAFFYPKRMPLDDRRVDFFELSKLTFEEPDLEVFKALKLAYEAMKTGGSMPTVFNAANEKAVRLFMNKEISFLEIADIIESEMKAHKVIENPLIDEIITLGSKIMHS